MDPTQQSLQENVSKPENDANAGVDRNRKKKTDHLWVGMILTLLSFFGIELFAYLLIPSHDWTGIAFGALWSVLLTALIWMLPYRAGRIVYGLIYYVMAAWTLSQIIYFKIFHKMMWWSAVTYAGEGSNYMDVILSEFSPACWIGITLLLILGGVVIWLTPRKKLSKTTFAAGALAAVLSAAGLFGLPELIFLRDLDIWGTHSEYAQSSSYRATYNTMYDAKTAYDICGIYQLSFRDLWLHEVYPSTQAYQKEQNENRRIIRNYFDHRGDAQQDNDMTGVLAGKNVVLVLMESMDDWLITPDDTPTICRLMEEGINFNNFYSPVYGSARTINTEFCSNTGIFLPTTGKYVFDYVTNNFDQSMASQLTQIGYTAEVFHYNTPKFYSRGVYEPAIGYHAYNSFEDYAASPDDLYNECFMFDQPDLEKLFFRDGKTFNFIITRSAHLSYVYNEVLSDYALRKYPEYRGKFGHEEVDCARVKARLVDDLYARLLQELRERGELENTVIVGITDHYTYGFKDLPKLLELSGVSDELELEKTPCFIWSADGPDMEIDKTLNTSDLLPTVLNLMGIDSPYQYLGQDAFDPDYEGYAFFTDGSWVSDGVMCKVKSASSYEILFNKKNKQLTDVYLSEMQTKIRDYVHISNLLLISDYYNELP